MVILILIFNLKKYILPVILFSLRYLNEMAQKSCIVGLPVVPFNQNKVSFMLRVLCMVLAESLFFVKGSAVEG